MLEIYHAPNTRGIRIIWLCEELGHPYQVKKIDFSAEYRATPEYRALNPVGKVPVMIDGDHTLFESGAMTQYLLDRYGEGRLQPSADSADYGPYLQWSWFAEATLMRPLGEIVNHGREFPGEERIDAVVEEMSARAVVAMEAVASHLNGRLYLLGDSFSAADIMMGYSLFVAELILATPLPEGLSPYYQRLRARPGFATALAA